MIRLSGAICPKVPKFKGDEKPEVPPNPQQNAIPVDKLFMAFFISTRPINAPNQGE